MRPNNYRSFVPIIFIILFALISISFVIPESSDTGDKEKKTRHCTRILNELARVSGLKSVEIPKLEVVDPLKNQSLAIAMIYDDGQPIIQIHEWTYDICMDMLGQDSTNGLAFIIAHELAHLTNNHLERNIFIDASIDSNDVEEVENLDAAPESRASQYRSAMDSIIQSFRGMTSRYNIRKNEAEADLYAGFTAYLAGYDTRNAGLVFFDHTYNFFTLNNKKGKYVSKEERKIIVEETAKQLDTLVQIFEMANLLTIAGQYNMATTCYQHVNKVYSSPALLNNIGLALILETMEHLNKDILPYYLPFTLNTTFVKAKSRGIDPPIAGDGDDPPTDNMIGDPAWIEGSVVKLKESIEYFKQVQIRHPKNYEAFLNESIANFLIVVFRKQAIATLWSDTDDYIRYAKTAAFKAKNSIDFGEPSDKGKSDVHCMMSILDHYTGNSEKATFHYNEATRLNDKNFLLKKNKHIVDSTVEATSFAGSSKNSICLEPELVFGTTSLEDLFNEVERWDIDVVLRKTDHGEKLVFTSKSYENGSFYNIELLNDNVAKEFYSVFQTNDLYTKKSECGMKTGMPMSEIDNRYGPKPKIIKTKSGSYHNFQMGPSNDEEKGVSYIKGTIFYSHDSETVDKWFIYEKMVPMKQSN